MLNRMPFPLTTAQISRFILEKEYATYITLQQVIRQLLEAHLISAQTMHMRTHLSITEGGIEMLNFFEDRINDNIQEELKLFLKDQEQTFCDELSIQSGYVKSKHNEFETTLLLREKNIDLLNITLSVPTEEIALSICENWDKKNEEIYQYIVDSLF